MSASPTGIAGLLVMYGFYFLGRAIQLRKECERAARTLATLIDQSTVTLKRPLLFQQYISGRYKERAVACLYSTGYSWADDSGPIPELTIKMRPKQVLTEPAPVLRFFGWEPRGRPMGNHIDFERSSGWLIRKARRPKQPYQTALRQMLDELAEMAERIETHETPLRCLSLW
jgi:hypothetical protein